VVACTATALMRSPGRRQPLSCDVSTGWPERRAEQLTVDRRKQRHAAGFWLRVPTAVCLREPILAGDARSETATRPRQNADATVSRQCRASTSDPCLQTTSWQKAAICVKIVVVGCGVVARGRGRFL
jgi:hypothetical protein